MSKSKKNPSQTNQIKEEVVEESVTETPVTEDVVTPEVTQEPGEPVSTDVNPEGETIEPTTESTENVEVTVDAPAPEGIVEVPATEEPKVDEPATETPVVDETVSNEPVVETPVTEESKADEPVVETPVTEESKADEPATETPVTDTPAVDDESKDKNPQPTTMTARTSLNGDKYGDSVDEPETPVTEGSKVETSSEPKADAVVVDRGVMTKELNKVYDVKFSYSQASRRFAVNRKMTLLAMYDLFVKNRAAFVGLKSQDDFKHIKEFMTGYSVLYNYKEIPVAGKTQFLEKLRAATDFVVLGK